MATTKITREITTKYKADASGLNKTLAGIDRSSKRTASALQKQNAQIDRLGATMRGLARVTAAFWAASQAVGWSREVVVAADSVRLLRLQMESLSGATTGFDVMVAKANELGIEFKDFGGSLNLLSPALKKLGVGFEDAADFAGDLTKAMRLAGVTTQGTSALLTQISQAISSNAFSGDELKSFSENAAGLAPAFEAAAKTILNTTASLKEMGSQGLLTGAVTKQAFETVFEDMREGFESLPQTLAQQEARFSNSAALLAEAIDEQFKISDFWGFLTGGAADMMESLANSLSDAPPVFGNAESIEIAREQMALLSVQIDAIEEKTRRLTGTERLRYQTLKAEYADYAAQDPELQLRLKIDELNSATVSLTQSETKRGRNRANHTAATLESVNAIAEEVGQLSLAVDALHKMGAASDSAASSTAALSSEVNALTANVSSNVRALDQARGAYQAYIAQGAAGLKQFKSSTAVSDEFVASLKAQAKTLKEGEVLGLKHIATAADSAAVVEQRIRFEEKLSVAQAQTAAASRRSTAATGAATKATRAYSAASHDAQREAEKQAATVERLARAMDPAQAAYDDLGETLTAVDAELARNNLSLEDHVKLTTFAVEAHQKQTDALTKGVKEVESSTSSLGNTIDRGITSAFMSAFTGSLGSAQDFMSSLSDTIVGGLASISAKVATKQIIIPLAGSLVGAGSASAAGGTSSLTSAAGVGGLFTGTSIGESLGASMAKGFGSVFKTAAPDWLSAGISNLAQVSNVALVGGGVAGGLAGNALFGGQGYGSAGSSVGSAAGALAGSMILPGIGTVLGGLLGGTGGGFLGSLFGGDEPTPLVTAGISGGRIGITGTQDIDEADVRALYEATAATNQVLDVFRTVLPETARAAVDAFNVAAADLRPEQFDAALTNMMRQVMDTAGDDLSGLYRDLFKQAGGDVGAFAAGIAELQQAFLVAGAAINAIQPGAVDNLEAVEDIFENFALADIGGIASGVASFAEVTQKYRSETDVIADATKDVADVFDRFGVSMPPAIENVEAWSQQIDLSRASGVEFAAALGSVSAQLGIVIDSTVAASQAEAERNAVLQETQAVVVSAINALSQGAVGGLQDVAEMLGAFDAAGLTQIADGLSAFSDVTRRYKSDADVLADATADVAEVFAQFGVDVPESIENIDSWSQQIDLSTEQGVLFAAALGGVSEQLGVVAESADVAGSALAAQADAQAQLVSGIQSFVDAAVSISDALGDTRQGIDEFGLGSDEIYRRRKAEADTLADALGEMLDADQILATTKQINDLISEGWSLLDDGQKSVLKNQFVGYLDEIDALAGERLGLGLSGILPEQGADLSGSMADIAGVMKTLDGSLGSSSSVIGEASVEMRAAAAEYLAAARAMQTAAQSIPSTITVTVRESEVG